MAKRELRVFEETRPIVPLNVHAGGSQHRVGSGWIEVA